MSKPYTPGEAFILNLTVATCLNLIHGLALMFAIDTIHRHWIHQLPTIGYWWAVVLVILMRGVFTPIQRKQAGST